MDQIEKDSMTRLNITNNVLPDISHNEKFPDASHTPDVTKSPKVL